MDKVSTERLRDLIDIASMVFRSAAAPDVAAALRELLAIRAEVEAQRPTPEAAAEMLTRTCMHCLGDHEVCRECVAAAITREREVAAARELALRKKLDEALEKLTATEASHQDEEAAHAETLDLWKAATARAAAAEKALAEARAERTEGLRARVESLVVELKKYAKEERATVKQMVKRGDEKSAAFHGGEADAAEGIVSQIRDVLAAADAPLFAPTAALASTPAPPQGIYIASRTRHAAKWRALRAAGVPVVCTWIDEAGEGETADWAHLWDRCVAEAAAASACIVYREGDEYLRGALVEMGAALALGRRVFWIGEPLGSAVRHRNVTTVTTIDEALVLAASLPLPDLAGDTGSDAPTFAASSVAPAAADTGQLSVVAHAPLPPEGASSPAAGARGGILVARCGCSPDTSLSRPHRRPHPPGAAGRGADHVSERIAGRTVIANISGGKDSAALSLWLKEQGIDHDRVFMDTGWEHPATYDYLRGELTRVIGPILELRAERQMVELIRHKGMFPSRGIRWCTSELKIKPLRTYLDGLAGDVVSAVGIRGEESAKRAAMAEWEWSEALDCETWRPLLRWTLADVISIHQRHGLKPNPLYLAGAERVGCWPCINSRKAEVRQVVETTPERVELIAQLEREVSARRGSQRAFFNGMTARGSVAPIEDVAEWATGRGQLVMLPDSQPGCMRWGMCETTTNTDEEPR